MNPIYVFAYLLPFFVCGFSKPLGAAQEKGIFIPESVYTLNTSLDEIFFPEITPYEEGRLQVSELHSIWYGQYGNPEGIPVVVVHGGPGAGCNPHDMRYFDPEFYRIILIDQRGGGRSIPRAEVKENTTAHLIQDMEAVRKHLKIKQWMLFGGSWGSTLSLAYGEAHPEVCLSFILRGVFLGTRDEYKQLWYGMKDAFPAEWEGMKDFIPLKEQSDLISAYYKRLMSQDPEVYYAAAKAFCKYDTIAAFLQVSNGALEKTLTNVDLCLSLARIFTHYCMNHFFFKEDQLIKNLPAIRHLPCIIVHGRYDMICRLQAAYRLHKAWMGSQLVIVPDAGHASSEPGVAKALVEATERMKELIKTN